MLALIARHIWIWVVVVLGMVYGVTTYLIDEPVVAMASTAAGALLVIVWALYSWWIVHGIYHGPLSGNFIKTPFKILSIVVRMLVIAVPLILVPLSYVPALEPTLINVRHFWWGMPVVLYAISVSVKNIRAPVVTMSAQKNRLSAETLAAETKAMNAKMNLLSVAVLLPVGGKPVGGSSASTSKSSHKSWSFGSKSK